MRDEADYTAFAEANALRLRQLAYLMCRDWHLAQDLTQTTLTKMYVAWKRVNKSGDPFFYARKVLLNTLLDHRRLRRSTAELTVDEVPEPEPNGADTTAVRLTLLEALMRLPERDRAIVVLRYWEDHSVEATAEILGVTIPVVKSQSMRSLAILRAHLGTDRELLFS